MKGSLFISFEGIDGAGKTTHIDALAAALQEQGRTVVRTREPGGTPLAEQLRALALHEKMDALTEALLMFAARRDHLLQVIEPALARGHWVVSDRFTDATFAYQGAGRGFDHEVLATLERWVQGVASLPAGTLRQPDVTIWFDLDPAVAAQRLALARVPDKFESQPVEFFRRVAAGYAERAPRPTRSASCASPPTSRARPSGSDVLSERGLRRRGWHWHERALDRRRQLRQLLAQRGHAWLLHGPSGLGQYTLAQSLAQAWLCDRPTADGACGHCASCHAIEVRTHADLCVLMPEVAMQELGWPLDEKAQSDIDDKKRKPSREIRVEAMRDAVGFAQRTSARGRGKVVLVYPAERMNTITANALLKTLEEPPGDVRFVLATEAAHQLLPTIRSRCLAHPLAWPVPQEAQAWLQEEGVPAAAAPGLLRAAGGRPSDAVRLRARAWSPKAWSLLPKAMSRGDVGAAGQLGPGAGRGVAAEALPRPVGRAFGGGAALFRRPGPAVGRLRASPDAVVA